MAKTKETWASGAVEAAMSANVEDLSDEELMDLWTEFGQSCLVMRERLKEFNVEHQKRVRKDQLRRQMDLTSADLELLQEVAAEGVVTEEAHGQMGGE
jgi:hypothetical protein